MKSQQSYVQFKVSHILWVCTLLPILTLIISILTNQNSNYTIVSNFQNVSPTYLQQFKAIAFRFSFIYLVFPSFMSLLAIKWWLDSSKNSSWTILMNISGLFALGGWALFAASIDRSIYNSYWVNKGQKIAIIFNTICMFLIFKNLIYIKSKVPNFIRQFSLSLKKILLFSYMTMILIFIVGMFEIINERIVQFLEYPLAFITYIFYWSFVLDLKPNNQAKQI